MFKLSKEARERTRNHVLICLAIFVIGFVLGRLALVFPTVGDWATTGMFLAGASMMTYALLIVHVAWLMFFGRYIDTEDHVVAIGEGGPQAIGRAIIVSLRVVWYLVLAPATADVFRAIV